MFFSRQRLSRKVGGTTGAERTRGSRNVFAHNDSTRSDSDGREVDRRPRATAARDSSAQLPMSLDPKGTYSFGVSMKVASVLPQHFTTGGSISILRTDHRQVTQSALDSRFK